MWDIIGYRSASVTLRIEEFFVSDAMRKKTSRALIGYVRDFEPPSGEVAIQRAGLAMKGG